MPQINDPKQPPSRAKLVALIGAPAAAILLSWVPAEESGRKVDTAVHNNTVVVHNVTPIKYRSPYLDIAGVPTACDGLTDGVKLGQHYTEAQCQTLMERALAVAARGSLQCTPLDPRRNPFQVVAIVDFSYNLGANTWCRSSAARAAASDNLTKACQRMVLYDKARVRGKLRQAKTLVRRRRREVEYCLTGLVAGKTSTNLAQRLKGI